MRLLLDTHAFIWFDSDPSRLGPAAAAACRDSTNELHLSVASVWEMQIKAKLGRLTLRRPLSLLVQEQMQRNNLRILPIVLAHVLHLDALPPLHKDPFDQLLVAQTIVEQLMLVSHDPVIRQYPIPILW